MSKIPAILPTMLVGSYAQPDWLIDKARLGERLPARVRARELWRIPADQLTEAQNDATIVAVFDQLRAGVDVLTDGEMRRESYSNQFANALEGLDQDNPGEAIDRTGSPVPVPRVVGEIRRVRDVECAHVALLKSYTDKAIKITLPGPFTMSQQAQNEFYPDDESLAMAYAAAVNDEVKALFDAGVDIVQLDEPYVQARADAARQYAIAAIDRALEGVTGTTALHVCFGYGKYVDDKPVGYAFLKELDACIADEISIECAQPKLPASVLSALPSKRIHVGVLDLRDQNIESADTVARRIESALSVLPAERMVVAPDCGMKYLSRSIAFGKMQSMVQGRNLVLGNIQKEV